MFERLFTRRSVLARHRDGPLAQERLAYLAHLADQGSSLITLQRPAQHLVAVADYLRLAERPDEIIRHEEIERQASRWARRARRRARKLHKRKGGSTLKQVFLWRATNWISFMGRLKQRLVPVNPNAGLLAAFADYMQREQGFSSATITSRCRFVRRFLDQLGATSGSLREITIARIDAAFLEMLGSGGHSRAAVHVYANHLRAFLHYAETRGWYPKGLADAIHGPRVYTHSSLPTGPSWGDVKRLLAAAEGDRPTDIRDRAILMLLAIYGLRSVEVRRLRLEDLDWEQESLRVACDKTRKTRTYPLSRPVGDAVLRYLKEVRPRSLHREVFLSLQAPIQPMGQLGSLVARRLRRLDLSIPHHGPHALRHACAAHLLDQGFTLKEIGDHLGHRDPDTTRIYAKVDLKGLRQVADFDLGGLL